MRDVAKELEVLIRGGAIVSASKLYGITLKYAVPTVYVEGRTQGYRLFVEAVNPCGMTDKIFVYQRKPETYKDQNFKDDFANVASLPDLEEYPEDAPSSSLVPFFRLNFFDVVVRSMDHLVDVAVSLHNQVVELVNTLDFNDKLVNLDEVRVGATCSSSSSSSGG